MKQIAGWKKNVSPAKMKEQFYKNDFDAYGLRFEKNFAYMVVSLRFCGMEYLNSQDKKLSCIAFYDTRKYENANNTVWLYESDIESIKASYIAVQDNGYIFHNYKYIIELWDGQTYEMQCVKRFEAQEERK